MKPTQLELELIAVRKIVDELSPDERAELYSLLAPEQDPDLELGVWYVWNRQTRQWEKRDTGMEG